MGFDLLIFVRDIKKRYERYEKNELLLRQSHNTFNIHAFQKVQVQISMLRLQKC